MVVRESQRVERVERSMLVSWRRALAALAVALLVAGVAACGGSGADNSDSGTAPVAEGKPPARPTGTLRVALAGESATGLDPSQPGGLANLPMFPAMYDGLAARPVANHDELTPALATSWRTNSDATVWTIELRRGVKFHDGTVFDSAAVKKNLEFYLRPTSFRRTAVGPVTRIETPDDYTVVLKYDVPFADLANQMMTLVMISPKLLEGSPEEVDKRVVRQAVGTGPYIVDSYSPARGLVLHANPDYWGDGPYIERLEFRPIPEESARIAALQSGDIDVVLGVTPQAAQSLGGDSRFKVVSRMSWANTMLSIATAKKPLDDVRVRQALAYAIDPKAIAEHVMLGKAVANGALMPPDTYGYVRPPTQYTYDPAKAKALLSEAGVKTPLTLRVAALASVPDSGLAGQAIVEQAKAAGFDLKLDEVTDAVLGAEVGVPNRKHDLFVQPFGWNGFAYHFSTGAILDQSNYTGKKLVNLVRAMQTTPDGPERKQIIADMLEAVQQELPMIPMYTKSVTDVFVKKLQAQMPPKDTGRYPWNVQYLTGG